MEFTATLAGMGAHASQIPIPDDIAAAILEQFGKRVICVINHDFRIHRAISKSKDIGYYLMVGKAARREMGIQPGQDLHLQIFPDETEFQADLPEELQEVLMTDADGNHAFEQLSDGKKRSLIHHVRSAKRSETRINRALKIVENLKLGMTDLREIVR